jgi:hypothetical protein
MIAEQGRDWTQSDDSKKSAGLFTKLFPLRTEAAGIFI